jgi:hypothetical protein
MKWLIWGLVLLMQNAAFTAVSRARNSGSLRYHAVAAVFSNGVWFASQFFVVAVLSEVIAAKDVGLGLATALFYLLLTTVS